ncbi:MAG: SIS domain-containing protein, partial [Nanoarchaeota archaeon]|nr:SIS domain-containing protein [Nanoarchaeota archaeon]
VIFTEAGPEIGVASTKAFTTQLAVLFLFSLYLGSKRGSLSKEKVKKLIEEVKKIPVKMDQTLELDSWIKECSEKYYSKSNALFLGRGVNYPIALEGALKLKEISYIHAEGYPAAEMKHGPIALIDENMPVVFLALKDSSYEKIQGNIQEVKSRGGKIIVIATERDTEMEKVADTVIPIPETADLLVPFLSVIPLQLLAYHIADKRGCDIDKPRNLAKSVTVE